MRIIPRALLLLILLTGAACVPAPVAEPVSASAPKVLPGPVSDVPAFERFIAVGPTPQQFRQRYPDVVLVLPGTAASKEFRMDRSRYFARLDEDGRISGGKFQ